VLPSLTLLARALASGAKMEGIAEAVSIVRFIKGKD
jgi:hypothetical protein